MTKQQESNASEKAPVAGLAAEAATPEKQLAGQRKIPGNLPYLPASGTLKKALDRIQEASRPDKYNADFLENVLKLKGGAARGTVPILKKMGFVASDGSPTDLYARFRTDSGRSAAAHQALRNAFPEIFKRSEYAHAVDDSKIKDIVLEITGLKPSDPIVSAIKSTFNVVKSYIVQGFDVANPTDDSAAREEGGQEASPVYSSPMRSDLRNGISLAYNINIVLPETSDLKVLNAIFRSIKENLMQ